jgi:hypothetical protein
MEAGFLGAQTWPSGLQWYLKETALGFTVSDPVATDHKLQMEYMRGGRCTECRVMVLAY